MNEYVCVGGVMNVCAYVSVCALDYGTGATDHWQPIQVGLEMVLLRL